MPELDGVAARRIKLGDDRGETRLAVTKAWRQLKKKAAHALAQDVCDHAEIPDQRFRAFELLDMRDEFADLHCIDEILAARLAPPGLDASDGRP